MKHNDINWLALSNFYTPDFDSNSYKKIAESGNGSFLDPWKGDGYCDYATIFIDPLTEIINELEIIDELTTQSKILDDIFAKLAVPREEQPEAFALDSVGSCAPFEFDVI